MPILPETLVPEITPAEKENDMAITERKACDNDMAGLIDVEAFAVGAERMMAEDMAEKLAKGKPVPPGQYILYAAAIREPAEAYVEIVWNTLDGPKAGEYLADAFDRRDAKDARRFAALLDAAGLSCDAAPAGLLDKTVIAAVRCVGGRKQNDVAAYKRDPRAEN